MRDNRDSLLYEVSVVRPLPKRSLGVFNLDRTTQSGDLIEYKTSNYEVKEVRCLYRYRAGIGYVMIRKLAETIEVNRAAEEGYLNRVMKLETTERS